MYDLLHPEDIGRGENYQLIAKYVKPFLQEINYPVNIPDEVMDILDDGNYLVIGLTDDDFLDY